MGSSPDNQATPVWMMPPQYSNLMASRRTRFVLFAALFCFFILTLLSLSGHPETVVQNLRVGQTSTVHNRTLGFQKVFAVGLPGRTDKRDAMVLASSYSDFDITWRDGVAFEDIPKKAIPQAFDDAKFPDTAIGCWRAHLNVMSTIVEERIETALIMEDDADWDVNVKAQLEEFARGTSKLQSDSPKTSPRGSPYGNNWDMLWIGHCHSGPHNDIDKLYFVENDTTVPPLPFRNGWWDNPHIVPEVYSNNTRIIFNAASGVCLWAYAMSYEGARKVLSAMSLQGGDGRQVDVTLSGWCNSKYLNSYSIYPPLFSSHRFAGSRSRDSDIQDHDAEEIHPESTMGVVYSTIMNVPRLVSGAKTVFSQWPNDTVPERGLNESYADQVSRECRPVDLMSLPEQEIPGVNTKGRLDLKEYLTSLEQ